MTFSFQKMLGLILLFQFLILTGYTSAQNENIFIQEVVPILARAGCNQGPCHGSLHGKGGFKLSLRAEDPKADFQTIVMNNGTRRLDISNPLNSLLLTKALGLVPHEGGQRFPINSWEYNRILLWITNGAKAPARWETDFDSIKIIPGEIVLNDLEDQKEIRIKGIKNGVEVSDLTNLASFDTSHSGIIVHPNGLVRCNDFLEGSISARYLNLQVSAKVLRIPKKQSKTPIAEKAPINFIDILVEKKLNRIGMSLGETSTDSQFLRRIYLDLNGQLPTSTEARSFLEDTNTDKREKLIDHLLAKPEFAETWALKWSDLLRNEEKALDAKGVRLFHGWIKRSFLENKPLDVFCREILAGRGSTYSNPEANFYRALRSPDVRAEGVAQVFLGLRLQCAKCHNHPFDRWTQLDYHRFSAFFSRIQYQVLENNKSDRLDKNEFVGEQVVWLSRNGSVQDPKDGKNLNPKFLGESTNLKDSQEDWLNLVSKWITSPHNPYFAKAQANRVWFHLMGKGIVDPLDDFRVSNLPINQELLDALGNELIRSGFQTKALIKTITLSNTYQSRCQIQGDPEDLGNFAYARSRPLHAEELFDAIVKVTGSEPTFLGYPEAKKAHEIPGVGGKLDSKGRDRDNSIVKFMQSFGKPVRSLTCECERSDDNTLGQAFHMISGESVLSMISSPNNKIARILENKIAIDLNLENLFLESLGRKPTSREIERAKSILNQSTNVREAWEDIFWGVLNSKEFLLRQ